MGRAFAAGLVRGRPGAGRAACVVADAVPAAVEAAVADAGGRPRLRRRRPPPPTWCAWRSSRRTRRRPWSGSRRGAAAGRGGAVGHRRAGTSTAWRRRCPAPALVRTMPNLAVRHGAGIVVLATRGLDDGREADAAAALLRAPRRGGAAARVASSPAATALAGSGPGLVAVVAEGLEEGGVAAGLTRAAGPRRWRPPCWPAPRPCWRTAPIRPCCDSVSARPRARRSPAWRCWSAAPCAPTWPTRCSRPRARASEL